MKEIIFVTGNRNKLEEARRILGKYGINIIGKKLEIREPMSSDQIEVVLAKAKQAFDKLKKPLIVDDSGVYFEAYNNFPGTFTKYLFKGVGYKGILKLLEGESRGAFFEVLVCYIDSKQAIVSSGRCYGEILKEVKGDPVDGCEYCNIFLPKGRKRPLIDYSLNERIKFFARAKALKKLAKILKNGVR